MRRFSMVLLFCFIIYSQEEKLSSLFFGYVQNTIRGETQSLNGKGSYTFGYRYADYDNNGLAIAFSFDLKRFSSIGPEGGFLDAETEELIIWDKDHSLGYVTISPQYQKTDTTGFAYFIGANISMNVLADIDIYAPGRHLLVDVSEDTRFFRISAQVGINYRTDNFVFSVAYERGFSSVFTSSADRSGAKLNSININIAYRYNIRF